MTDATMPARPTTGIIPDTGRPLVVYAVRGLGGGWAWSCRRCGAGYWMTSGHADVLAAALWHCADRKTNAPESGE